MKTACEITFMGKPLHLVGKPLELGAKAPEWVLLDASLTPVRLKETTGVRIFATFPSVDTPVCDSEMKRFQQEAAKRPCVKVYGVSADLPFAQKRWAEENDAEAITFLSDFDQMSLGEAWGVRIQEVRLLARAVFVLDPQDIVRHLQVVPELTSEPDYAAALAEADRIA